MTTEGKVYSHNYNHTGKKKELKGADRNGYLAVALCKDGKQKIKYIHRLVAEAFIPNPENKPQANHIDGNKQNNVISNLEWNSQSENTQHAYDTGLTRTRAVIQIDNETNDVIAKYSSIKEATLLTRGHQGNICQVCKGKYKTSEKFIWRYAV